MAPNEPQTNHNDTTTTLTLRKRYSALHLLVKSAWSKNGHDHHRDSSHYTATASVIHKWRTVEYATLPEWLQWNEYVHRGHRPPIPSLIECTKSIFSLHTETMNIWTHFLAFLGFLFILLDKLVTPDHELALREKFYFSIYLSAMVTCFALSTIFHTLGCHSEFICKISCSGDYLGIILAMLGVAYSFLFYLFWCDQHISFFYSLFYTAVAVGLTWLTFSGSVYGADKYWIRASLGSSVLISGFLCLCHFFTIDGFWYALENYPLKRMILSLFIFVLATVLYSFKIPERWWPGKFDIWFHSHQIFHALVVMGSGLGYHCLQIVANFRITQNDSLKCNENYTLGLSSY